MKNKKLLLRVIGGISLFVIAFATVQPAYGKATIVRFKFQESFSDIGPSECMPSEIIGTVNGTELVMGQIVDTDPGFHVEATANLDYRIDFSNGTYALGSSVEHISFGINPLNSRTTSTVAIREPRTIYNADGYPIGKVMIHYISHITYSDANGNGQPDSGEITTYVEDFRFVCYS